MATVPDTQLPAATTPAEDPTKGGVYDPEKAPDEQIQAELRVVPDQFDPRYETGKKEIWAYYSYYVGNNGLSLFNFGPTAFQNLLSQAANEDGLLMFAGRMRSVNSIVLLSNGISFAIQMVLFLVLGSYADFGSWRPNILIACSIVAWGIGFGWLGVHTSDKWEIGVGLYIVGLIAYQTCITFWTAAFPGLARNTPALRAKADSYAAGHITRAQYDTADSMQRNRLSNMSFYTQSVFEVLILAVILGVMFGLHVRDSEANNNWGLSVLIALATGVWVLCGVPWFIVEKRRPGQKVPAGMNVVAAGFWQLWRAMSQVWKLKQSFLYLVGYFLLGDSLNTTVTVIATLQNEVVAYDAIQLTYLLLVGIAAQAVGIYAFWFVQRKYEISTKIMFDIVAISIILLDGWGLVGIWSQRFGFHHLWEIWAYQAFYGLLVCPWYSYSQTMISEVTPRGHEFLFFSLFSIIGKTSAFIGPFISSAIIDRANNNNSTPFYFLFGLSIFAFCGILFWVDLGKSRVEQQEFLDREEEVRERRLSKVEAVVEEREVANGSS